jgi:hypothetical protein
MEGEDEKSGGIEENKKRGGECSRYSTRSPTSQTKTDGNCNCATNAEPEEMAQWLNDLGYFALNCRESGEWPLIFSQISDER